MNDSTMKLAFVGAIVASLLVSCEATPEPRLEASASDVGGSSPTEAPATPAPNVAKLDLYVVDPETGEATQLLSGPGSQQDAEVSPDGRRVVYESGAPGVPPQIFVLEAGGAERKLTQMKRGASDPTWSPDGTQIAFAGTRPGDGDPRPDADIFVMNADGSRIRRLAGTPRPDGNPDWSPDGSLIAFHEHHVHDLWQPAGFVWVASVSTRALTRVTGGRDWSAGDPAWSPDGRWIAYSGFGGDTLNGRVYTSWLGLTRPTGIHERRLRESPPLHLIENPSWSPDGRRIVFEENDPPAVGIRWDGHVGNVGIIDVRTKRTRWLVKDARSDQPSWGPDGISVSLTPDAVAMPQATTGWHSMWEASWTRPDATVVLTGSRCELDGEAHVIDPGVLAIEFVNESYREGYIKVVQVPPGRRLGDLRAWIGMAGGWGERNEPSASDVWSSPREVTSGTWAVVCFKDLIDAPNGFQVVRAGVAGPIEIG